MFPTPKLSLTDPGHFVIGCNYWASHAGTRMWSDWQPGVVDADFHQLSSAGLQVLRVFPLWPDFQPIHLLRSGAGQPHEVRFGESPLPDDPIGQAGISAEMLDRFEFLADSAEKFGLKLIVGLITGWMSGRLYVPPALEGLNVLTDPFAIQWQMRFIRTFVRRFRTHPAVLAWDLGNECNCMADVPSRAAAFSWTAAVTAAIRAEDAARPVVSGMHSLSPALKSAWTMQDQGELTDLLTTHPYPYFTPHCDQDPVNTIRSILHSTSESRFYADIGGKPCLPEELGTLGPFPASDQVAADYIRSCLFSLWANDCHGLLWWCAYDQSELAHAPYDWNAIERELGLARPDRSEKPVLAELTNFRKFLDGLPIKALPPRLTEAVCILSHDQDQWGAAYSALVLSKQAGFDLQYQFSDQPISPASLYLLPCVSGQAAIPRRRWLELLDLVRDGAVLYVSHTDGVLSPFNQVFGVEIQTRSRRTVETSFTLPESGEFHLSAPVRLTIQLDGAEAVGLETDGNPVFTHTNYGKGQVYFLSIPLEQALATLPGAFHTPDAQPFWEIYRQIFASVKTQRIASKTNPFLGLTEHPLDSTHRVIILVNYSPQEQVDQLTLAPDWQVKTAWHGNFAGLKIVIPANDALVLLVENQIG
jgi:hypothetical protein